MLAICTGHDFVCKKGRPEITIFMGHSNAILMIRFNSDHTLEFPSHIDFYPRERHWHWDQKNQCILFTDKDDKKVISRYSAPIIEKNYYISLKCLTEPNVRYVAYLAFDMTFEVSPQSSVSWQTVLFTDKQKSDGEQAKINSYVISKQAETVWLDDRDEWQLLDAAWEKIVNNSKLKNVCILLNGAPTETDNLFSNKLQLNVDDTELQFIAGNRQDVLSILSQMLVRHNQQIMTANGCLSPVKMIKDILL